MHGYILTDSKLKYQRNLQQLWVLGRGDLFSCVRNTPLRRKKKKSSLARAHKQPLKTIFKVNSSLAVQSRKTQEKMSEWEKNRSASTWLTAVSHVQLSFLHRLSASRVFHPEHSVTARPHTEHIGTKRRCM